MYKHSFNVSSSIHFTSKSYINSLPSAELLPTTLLPNQVYLYIYIYPIKSVNTLRCQTYPILFSSRQPNVSAHLPEKWFAQHAQNLPWNSDRAKDIDIPLLPSNHDLYRNTLYPLLWVYLDAYPARIKQLPIWNTGGNLWKPLSTLPEEIHISKFEDL